jgi:hypothetical protein
MVVTIGSAATPLVLAANPNVVVGDRPPEQ